jgi:hypothetical protein
MSALEKDELRAIPPDFRADTEAIMEHLTSGRPLAPDVAQRIRERGERIREEVFRRHGVLDIGSPSIRELRDA